MGCLEGTREDILFQILDWVKSQDGPGFFWLSGGAGTGKTAIAQSACEHLDEEHRLGASFFFSRHRGDRNTASVVIPTILYQLAQARPVLLQPICRALGKTHNAASNTIEVQARTLLTNAFTQLSSIVSPVVIVLDGFEDYVQDRESLLLALLRVLPLLPFQTKLLFTSRLEPNIQAVFHLQGLKPSSTLSLLHHELERHGGDEDIQRYLHHHLDLIAAWNSSSDKVPIAQLVKQSKNHFGYAAALVRYLDNVHLDFSEQYQALLASAQGSDSDIMSPYQSLDHLYKHILLRTMPIHGDGEIFMERRSMLVGAIILLQEPLAQVALEKLLGLDDSTVSSILGSLHAVLVVPCRESLDRIRIRDPCFSDFITSPKRCHDSANLINIQDQHTRLTERCLMVILGNPGEDPSILSNLLQFHADGHGREKNAYGHTREPLLYSCMYWAYHLANAVQTPALLQLITAFSTDKLFWWLESLSLCGRLHRALKALSLVESWCKASRFRALRS